MRRCWLMLALGLGLVAAVGCCGSRQEVRLITPAGQPTIQDRLDGVGANYVARLLGGP